MTDNAGPGSDGDVSSPRPRAEPETPQREFHDITLYGRRPGFMHLVSAVLFLAVVTWVLVGGHVDLMHFVLLGIALLNLWLVASVFVLAPRIRIREGVFSLRAIRSWTTPATNVAAVALESGKLVVTFQDLSLAQHWTQRRSRKKRGKQYGCDLLTFRGAYSLKQAQQLQAALGLPHQPHDRFAEFEQTLQRLTPHVWVTPLLILINLAVFLAMLAAGADPLQPRAATMLAWGANSTPLTAGGEWWRLLTCTFLHFGLFHLLINLWILRDIGREAERLLGNVGFLISYLFAGVMGSVASIVWNQTQIGAGASGAVFGVFGMLLGYVTFQRGAIPMEVVREHRFSALTFLVLNVAIAWGIAWIDQAAHIGGFVTGVVSGVILGGPITRAARQRVWRNSILAVVAVVLTGLSVVLLPS